MGARRRRVTVLDAGGGWRQEVVEAPVVLGLESAFFSAGLAAPPLDELEELDEDDDDEVEEGLSLAEELARESVR